MFCSESCTILEASIMLFAWFLVACAVVFCLFCLFGLNRTAPKGLKDDRDEDFIWQECERGNYVSPYLLLPLRSVQQVHQERHQRFCEVVTKKPALVSNDCCDVTGPHSICSFRVKPKILWWEWLLIVGTFGLVLLVCIKDWS